MDENKNYPYLGALFNKEGKRICVLFTAPDEGVVLAAEYDHETLKFGYNDIIDEEQFVPVPAGVNLTISN